MLLNSTGQVIARLPISYPITISRDRRKFMTLEIDGFNIEPVLRVYNEHGELLHKIADEITYTDFTAEGAPLWGSTSVCHILNGTDTLTYDAPSDKDIDYAYGNLSTGLFTAVLAERSEYLYNPVRNLVGVNVSGISNGYSDYLPGTPVGIHTGKGFAIMLRHTQAAAGQPKDPADTLTRYSLREKGAQQNFIVPEGVKNFQFNQATGDLMVYTQDNRLLVLDSQLKIKKGLLITSNDLYGMATGGQTFFYARDRYLTIFANDTSRLNVFDRASVWSMLYAPGSPVKPITDKKRFRELGLHFK